jgi:hypothetical protein
LVPLPNRVTPDHQHPAGAQIGFLTDDHLAELAMRGLKVNYHSVRDFVNAEKRSFKKLGAAGKRDVPT